MEGKRDLVPLVKRYVRPDGRLVWTDVSVTAIRGRSGNYQYGFAMIQDARKVLGEMGFPSERVHFELFYVDEPPPELHRADPVVEGDTSDVTIVLDGLSSTAPMPRAQTILDAAQRTRSDLPFACKGGVCGTCRALVREGEVDMRRNYALEEAEVEAGFVLTCQSHPVSDSVTVDFDA